MPAWVVWLIAAGVLGVAEVLSLTLVLGMLAVAAVVGAGVAALGGPAALQVLSAAIAAVLLLGVVRPIARRHRVGMPPSIRTGSDALVGKQAVVLEQVDRSGGRVKLGGEVWTARAYDGAQVIPVGHTVDVLRIDGATALVHALELP